MYNKDIDEEIENLMTDLLASREHSTFRIDRASRAYVQTCPGHIGYYIYILLVEVDLQGEMSLPS